jgi:hypothetical protein
MIQQDWISEEQDWKTALEQGTLWYVSHSWGSFVLMLEQVNFILGMIIVLGASVMNAFGLNLTKMDHVRILSPRVWQSGI